MLQRTLYPRARWRRGLVSREACGVDRGFVASVGRLTRRADFFGEVREFRGGDRNQTFWRGALRLRISTDRMQALFREVWPGTTEV